MSKSISQRLEKAEEAAEHHKLWQRRCGTCGSPIPAMLCSILLGPGGYYRVGLPCLDCLEQGGSGHRGIDPRTGEPDSPPKLILLDMDFEDWLDQYGEKRFGGAIDLTLAYHREGLAGWEMKVDFASPRMPEQCAEAETATMTFPYWGDASVERLGLARDGR